MTSNNSKFFHSDEEREKAAIVFIELLFPFFRNDLNFQIWQVIGNYQTINNLEYSNFTVQQMMEIDDFITQILIDKGLAEKIPNAYPIKLTEYGKEYQKKLLRK